MDAAVPAAPPRRWHSLLTDRWHTSSRVVMLLLLLVLVFCNVPAQSVTRVDYGIGDPNLFSDDDWQPNADSQCERGWPLTYMVGIDWGPGAREVTAGEGDLGLCFGQWDNCLEFRLWSLLANGCVVLMAALAFAVAFEAWRRQRSRLWQLHLRDLFAATLVVSLVAAWYVREQHRYAVEEAIFSPSNGSEPSLDCRASQPGGVKWLRACLPDETPWILDRPFAVSVDQPAGWSQLEQLTSVHHVWTLLRASTDELGHLANMPQLEALSLDEFAVESRPDNDHVIAELPPLPKLRGLYLAQPAHRCADLIGSPRWRRFTSPRAASTHNR